MDKIGLAVTTYNSENWFDQLYNTIPFSKLDECVIINGGDKYSKRYNKHTKWIQHKSNHGPAQARIDGIQYLMRQGCEHIFVIEDDMLFKHEDVFDQYINASQSTGICYFCYCSNAPGTGNPGARTPRIQVDYNDIKISFYSEMHNEFTYYRKSVFDDIGYYDQNYKHLWDVEFVYRVLTSEKYGCGFRYFPDIENSDIYIQNLPESINNSRLNADNMRNKELGIYFQMFEDKYKHHISRVPILTKHQFLNKLKTIFNNK